MGNIKCIDKKKPEESPKASRFWGFSNGKIQNIVFDFPIDYSDLNRRPGAIESSAAKENKKEEQADAEAKKERIIFSLCHHAQVAVHSADTGTDLYDRV